MPPDSPKGYTERERYEWKTEYDVVTTLRQLGHDVKPLGVADELAGEALASQYSRQHAHS